MIQWHAFYLNIDIQKISLDTHQSVASFSSRPTNPIVDLKIYLQQEILSSGLTNHTHMIHICTYYCLF